MKKLLSLFVLALPLSLPADLDAGCKGGAGLGLREKHLARKEDRSARRQERIAGRRDAVSSRRGSACSSSVEVTTTSSYSRSTSGSTETLAKPMPKK